MKTLKRSILVFLLAISGAGSVRAAAGDPIVSNDYRLDLTRTVTTGSTRKIGMGGAFVGLAEGNAAIPDNPAAVAYRPRAFMRDWEFDMVLGSVVTTDDDADNSGSSSLIYGDQLLVDFGLMGQYKRFGMGGVGQATVVDSDNLPEGENAQFLSGTAALGYTFLDDQIAVGFSFDPVGARLKDETHRNQTAFHLTGWGWGTGMIWHPNRGHWHFGAALASSVSSNEDLPQSTSPVTVGSLIVPKGVYTTGSLAVGTAYEWNQFPLWRSRPAIGTFDVRFFGDSPADANGSNAFVKQTAQPSGQKTIMTIHGGLEVEALPRVLRLRIGTYREPSRYDDVATRYHITGGFEVRLTKRNVWDKRPLAISYAFDHAARYQVHSVSIWLYTFTIPVPSREENAQKKGFHDREE